MKNKRILFFAPNFFGYELEIKKELESMGAIVDFYDDRPSNKTLHKILIRINPKLISNLTNRYFNKIVTENKKNNYDFVFFIKCEAASEKNLQLLKNKFNQAKFILYLYDSVDNIKFYGMKQKFFDEIFSFDLKNTLEFPKMKFRPLFYLRDYQRSNLDSDYKFDLSFIATSHSDRPKIVNQLRKQLDASNKKYYFRLYTPSKLMFYLKKLYNKDFRELNKCGCITLKKMNSSDVSEIINKSKVVLDIQHPKQSGLTIRTIELLGMQKKLITTNENIQSYDFYNSDNIYIVNRKFLKLEENFFCHTYIPLDLKVYKKYSIKSWVCEIFDLRRDIKW